MVRKIWLYLILLSGCPAEKLKVVAPKGGIEEVSHEDLQRDIFLIDSLSPRLSNNVATYENIGSRLAQMGTMPSFGENYTKNGNTCGIKQGVSNATIMVLAEDKGDLAGACAVATVISLAKTMDLSAPPSKTHVFCRITDRKMFESNAPIPWNFVEKILLITGAGKPFSKKIISLGGINATELSSDNGDIETLNYVNMKNETIKLYYEYLKP